MDIIFPYCCKLLGVQGLGQWARGRGGRWGEVEDGRGWEGEGVGVGEGGEGRVNGRGAKSVCKSVLPPPQAEEVGSSANFKKCPFLVISPLTCCQQEELQACTSLYSHPARHSWKQPPPLWGRVLLDTGCPPPLAKSTSWHWLKTHTHKHTPVCQELWLCMVSNQTSNCLLVH